VKDFDQNGNMTDVGRGVIDWQRIFAQSNVAGIKHYFVEHDNPKLPFDSIQISYGYLKNLRF
jgi:sugar phosphate isomerase/epimerase